MFDSAPDGSVALTVHYGDMNFGVEIYDAKGTLTHKWEIPEWKERTIDELSYDGKQVMLIRTDGLYGLSKDGRPLWYFPLTTAKELAKAPKGTMQVVWPNLRATLADGANMIVTGEVGTLGEMLEGVRHYKVRIYRLP